jgi:methionyl-tRNA formyltransferase
LGTPEFAVPSLEKLIASHHEVVAVVTTPDKPSGRGLQMTGSAVKVCALQYGIPILQPEKLKDPDFINALRHYKADLFVVVAFRMLPEMVWNMPPLGTINLHGSLLPKYRGAAPINRAIMNGETETGVTIFQLQHEIDTGQVFQRASLHIGPDDNATQLHDRMMIMGADVLLDAVNQIADKKITSIPQQDLLPIGELPHAPKIFKEDGQINWHENGTTIHNQIRGLANYPGAFTSFQSKQLKVYSGRFEYTGVTEHNWKSDQQSYLKFGCNNGWYHVLDVQLEGKKRMNILELLRGYRF